MSAHYGFDDEDGYDGSLDDYIERNTMDDDWGCAFPDNCCMAFAPHMRDECHTPEMAEEWLSPDDY
jgi:hypothetical protein